MPYRTDVSSRDRSGAIAAVIAIHAALLFAFLNISGKVNIGDTQRPLNIFNLSETPPPPPPPPRQRQRPRPREKEGGSSPKNIKSQATPVVAPKPRIVTPPVQKIAATETPRQRAAPTQGASDVHGPGTGAGGVGTGTGNGNGGTGPGGGGDVADPPHLVTPVLSGRDFPSELLDEWPPRATVFLRLRIDSRGYVSECLVDRGTGVSPIDSIMCNLAHERLRFRPALNRSGQAVAGWFGYAQPAPR